MASRAGLLAAYCLAFLSLGELRGRYGRGPEREGRLQETAEGDTCQAPVCIKRVQRLPFLLSCQERG